VYLYSLQDANYNPIFPRGKFEFYEICGQLVRLPDDLGKMWFFVGKVVHIQTGYPQSVRVEGTNIGNKLELYPQSVREHPQLVRDPSAIG
jgi:hypothetical protein